MALETNNVLEQKTQDILNQTAQNILNQNNSEKQQNKEDIPEILKEVTTGNYMYDIAKSAIKEKVYKENVQFEETSDLFDEDIGFDIEKAFDSIENQDLINVSVEQIEDGLVEDIDNEFIFYK